MLWRHSATSRKYIRDNERENECENNYRRTFAIQHNDTIESDSRKFIHVNQIIHLLH